MDSTAHIIPKNFASIIEFMFRKALLPCNKKSPWSLRTIQDAPSSFFFFLTTRSPHWTWQPPQMGFPIQQQSQRFNAELHLLKELASGHQTILLNLLPLSKQYLQLQTLFLKWETYFCSSITSTISMEITGLSRQGSLTLLEDSGDN